MNRLKDDWEKKRRKIWEQQLGYDEDACEQIPEEDSPICTKASPASRGERFFKDEKWPSS